MVYEAQISRANPTALVFMVDLSYSMIEPMPGAQATKAASVTDIVNKTLSEFVIKSTSATEVRDYFHVAVVGYGNDWAGPLFDGPLAGRELVPISDVAANPLRVEQRRKLVPDGAGGVVEIDQPFALWFDPVAAGNTPMCAAFEYTHEILSRFLTQFPNCFPPVVLNLTDGQANDGDPRPLAEDLVRLSSTDGEVLLFNAHVAPVSSPPVEFANSVEDLPSDPYAEHLYAISSVLPDKVRTLANAQGHSLAAGARGYVFNGSFESLVRFIEIGTIGTSGAGAAGA